MSVAYRSTKVYVILSFYFKLVSDVYGKIGGSTGMHFEVVGITNVKISWRLDLVSKLSWYNMHSNETGSSFSVQHNNILLCGTAYNPILTYIL